MGLNGSRRIRRLRACGRPSESRHVWICVMWMSHSTHGNELCHGLVFKGLRASQWVLANVNESWRILEWVMAHVICDSRHVIFDSRHHNVTHIWCESWLIYESRITWWRDSCMIYDSRITSSRLNQSFRTCHVWIRSESSHSLSHMCHTVMCLVCVTQSVTYVTHHCHMVLCMSHLNRFVYVTSESLCMWRLNLRVYVTSELYIARLNQSFRIWTQPLRILLVKLGPPRCRVLFFFLFVYFFWVQRPTTRGTRQTLMLSSFPFSFCLFFGSNDLLLVKLGTPRCRVLFFFFWLFFGCNDLLLVEQGPPRCRVLFLFFVAFLWVQRPTSRETRPTSVSSSFSLSCLRFFLGATTNYSWY